MRELAAVLLVSALAGGAFGIARPIVPPAGQPQNTEITALRDAP